MSRSFSLALLAASLPCAFVDAQTLPTGFVNETMVSSGLTAPHDFCFLPDGRVLIANRPGGVTLWVGGSSVSTVGNVANVLTGSERGLLSIEPDPNFPTNGYIYVWYSSTQDSFMHLDRFTCTGDLSNPASTNLSFSTASRRVILAAVPDNAFNHNGGSARFGPDGMLYMCIGDDANNCTAQNTSSQLGCLLRMDLSALPAGGSLTAPSFSTLDPGTNPLSNNNDISQLVIGYGLRNPFRMEIDQVTGSLYIGDVGQNAVEEYSEYVYPVTGPLPLRNFGWPWREGNNTFSGCGGSAPGGLVPPIAAVNQGGGWASVMGGPRYRNQGGTFDFGPSYEGVAFFHDYYAGQMRALEFNGSTWSTLPPVAGQPGAWWATGFSRVTAVRQGPDGALYYTQRSGSSTSGGTFERFRPLGPTNSVISVSGESQRTTIGETFAQPFRVQVLDTMNQPLAGGTVNFNLTGSGSLSTTNPVIADSNGFAQTTVTAGTGGGGITVTASTPGSQTTAAASLFARKLNMIQAGTLSVLTVTNITTAPTPQVPYVIMVGFPGAPGVTIPGYGFLCADPASALTIIIEDGTGIFGGVSYSGTGGTGSPNLTKIYNLPPGLLTGLQLNFTGVGFDAVDGPFLLNCDTEQY